MTRFLRPLAMLGGTQQYGGKSNGLAWLVTQGCAVPEAWVLPVSTFDTHIEQSGLSELVQDLVSGLDAVPPLDDIQLQATSTKLQLAIKQSPLADSLSRSLKDFWQNDQQGGSSSLFAVRSSALSEDGQVVSFAGQFDSVLHITNVDDLEHAIKQVWASTFNVHALRYGQHHKQAMSRMAVIIQQQVDAAVSGVLFTQNPTKNTQQYMLLECCEGLADRLVAGDITPTSVQIDRHSLEISDHQESDDTSFDVSQHIAVLQHLGQQALQLEQVAGNALDIEWCIDKDNKLFFVQCRPMTAGAQADVTLPIGELWSNANIAENFPRPVVPLLASFVPRGYAGYFRGLGGAFGIDRAHMDRAKVAFDGLVGLQAGHLYYNLTNIFSVIHLVPGGAWLAQSFNLFTGAEGSPEPQSFPRPWYRQAWQLINIIFQVPRQYCRVKPRIKQFEQMIDDYAQQTQPATLAQQLPDDLALHLKNFLDIRENRWGNAALADTAAMVCYAALKSLIKRWLPLADQAQLHNDLLQGLPGLVSSRPVEELWLLSAKIRKDPQATALFSEQSVSEVMQVLPQQAPAIWQAVQCYLERWGFRYSGELMLTQETPVENPQAIFQLLQSYLLDTGKGPMYLSQQRASEREQMTDKIATELTPASLLRWLPLPSRAAIFRRLVNATHGAIKLRERARMKQALLYTRLRHVCLALGDLLVERSWLIASDDIFYLEIDEAIALAEKAAKMPQAEIKTLQQKIIERRQAMSDFETLNPPDKMTLARGEQWRPEASLNEASIDPDVSRDILKGVGACGGVVSGTAAVLMDVTQISSSLAGSILVTRQTDPGWAPVFFLVKGLVIERGGMLSHGAIIAREYGIPAVVGVSQATKLIRSGESLIVDGTQGQLIRKQNEQ